MKVSTSSKEQPFAMNECLNAVKLQVFGSLDHDNNKYLEYIVVPGYAFDDCAGFCYKTSENHNNSKKVRVPSQGLHVHDQRTNCSHESESAAAAELITLGTYPIEFCSISANSSLAGVKCWKDVLLGRPLTAREKKINQRDPRLVDSSEDVQRQRLLNALKTDAVVLNT